MPQGPDLEVRLTLWFLPPYIVIGSFQTNEMKILSFVIPFALGSCLEAWSLVGMGWYNDGLSGQDRRACATSG